MCGEIERYVNFILGKWIPNFPKWGCSVHQKHCVAYAKDKILPDISRLFYYFPGIVQNYRSDVLPRKLQHLR